MKCLARAVAPPEAGATQATAGAHRSTPFGMSTTERVTVSLPTEVPQAAKRVAEATGVRSPLSSMTRSPPGCGPGSTMPGSTSAKLHPAAFSEDELRALAAETGVPCVPPTASRSAA